jgi:hypothetical protein
MFLLLRSWSLSFVKPDRTIKLEIPPHLHDQYRRSAARFNAKTGVSRRSGVVSGIYLASFTRKCSVLVFSGINEKE